MQDADPHALYDQATEVRLLIALLRELEDRTVVDVGAERGSFVAALLRAGADRVYAFEPYPASVAALRARFGDNSSVHLFDVALGAQDGTVNLHVVEDKTHQIDDAYHTLVAFDETPTLRVVGNIPVRCRTVGSLVAEGRLPPHVGIVKVDTERSDLAVLQGMGALSSDVVMVEYWDDLPETVGPASYAVSEVVALMAARGYANYVVVKRHDQFETLQLNDANTRSGDWGNLIFAHDAAFPRLSRLVFEAVAQAQTRLVDRAMYFAAEAEKRLAVIQQDRIAAAASVDANDHLADELLQRERVIDQLRATAEERLRLTEQANAAAHATREECARLVRSLQEKEQVIAALARTAEERLRLVEQIGSEAAQAREWGQRLLASLHEKDRLIADLTATADERLRLVEQAHTSSQDLARSLQEKEQMIAQLTAMADERLHLAERAHYGAAQARAAYAELADSLHRKDRTIAELHRRIAQLDADAARARHS